MGFLNVEKATLRKSICFESHVPVQVLGRAPGCAQRVSVFGHADARRRECFRVRPPREPGTAGASARRRCRECWVVRARRGAAQYAKPKFCGADGRRGVGTRDARQAEPRVVRVARKPVERPGGLSARGRVEPERLGAGAAGEHDGQPEKRRVTRRQEGTGVGEPEPAADAHAVDGRLLRPGGAEALPPAGALPAAQPLQPPLCLADFGPPWCERPHASARDNVARRAGGPGRAGGQPGDARGGDDDAEATVGVTARNLGRQPPRNGGAKRRCLAVARPRYQKGAPSEPAVAAGDARAGPGAARPPAEGPPAETPAAPAGRRLRAPRAAAARPADPHHGQRPKNKGSALPGEYLTPHHVIPTTT